MYKGVGYEKAKVYQIAEERGMELMMTLQTYGVVPSHILYFLPQHPQIERLVVENRNSNTRVV